MPAIKGYRELSKPEIELINKLKTLGDDVGAVIEEMQKLSYFDQRWVAIGKTDLQKGFMALVRAVAKPTGF
jgi:hypothetical protein